MKTTKFDITAPRKGRSCKNSKGKNFTRAKNFSQIANATSPTTPITIITMMLALCHEWLADRTRLNGRVVRVKPPDMSTAPTTICIVVS